MLDAMVHAAFKTEDKGDVQGDPVGGAPARIPAGTARPCTTGLPGRPRTAMATPSIGRIAYAAGGYPPAASERKRSTKRVRRTG